MTDKLTLQKFKFIWLFRSKFMLCILALSLMTCWHLFLADHIATPIFLFSLFAVGFLARREMVFFKIANDWENQPDRLQHMVIEKGTFFINLPAMGALFRLYCRNKHSERTRHERQK